MHEESSGINTLDSRLHGNDGFFEAPFVGKPTKPARAGTNGVRHDFVFIRERDKVWFRYCFHEPNLSRRRPP